MGLCMRCPPLLILSRLDVLDLYMMFLPLASHRTGSSLDAALGLSTASITTIITINGNGSIQSD